MNILRLCYDWRVLTAVAAVAVGVFVFAPSLLAAAVPLLLLAACPLSMLVMMRAMGAKEGSAEPSAAAAPDPITAVRSELADLHRRREELVQELKALEASPGSQTADSQLALDEDRASMVRSLRVEATGERPSGE